MFGDFVDSGMYNSALLFVQGYGFVLELQKLFMFALCILREYRSVGHVVIVINGPTIGAVKPGAVGVECYEVRKWSMRGR